MVFSELPTRSKSLSLVTNAARRQGFSAAKKFSPARGWHAIRLYLVYRRDGAILANRRTFRGDPVCLLFAAWTLLILTRC